MKLTEVRKKLEAGAFAEQFEMLYGNQAEELARQKKRYLDLVDRFEKQFPGREDVRLYSAPGRTEIGGNHTDHQHGCVLAAAVNLDVIAVVAFHDEGVIRLKSTGYPMDTIDLSQLEVQPQEKGKAAALIRVLLRLSPSSESRSAVLTHIPRRMSSAGADFLRRQLLRCWSARLLTSIITAARLVRLRSPSLASMRKMSISARQAA